MNGLLNARTEQPPEGAERLAAVVPWKVGAAGANPTRSGSPASGRLWGALISRFGGALLLAGAALFVAAPSQAIEIVITEGRDSPTRIAVVPFGGPPLRDRPGPVGPLEVADIIAFDLMRSGQFDALPSDRMLSYPATPEDVYFRDWRMQGMDYVVIGNNAVRDDGRIAVTYHLFDVNAQREIETTTWFAAAEHLRDVAHWIADEVYERITGVRGAFATKILYVLVRRPGAADASYQLVVADSDGERERVLFDTPEPLLSPSWAPDGRRVAYVSFETGRSTIVVQEVESGVRTRVAAYKGINGAPVFSPDGRKLAMSLSRDGNPEIYVKDLETGDLERITRRHNAIDTEPSWGEDGKSLIFTSDRGGRPQIYRKDLTTGLEDRLTFEGDYNARAHLLPGGRHLVYVHRYNRVYHIAWQDLERDVVHRLTETSLDESPTLAPNGTMAMYATQQNGRGILAVVSVDSRVRYNLSSAAGDVREPAWSPYLATDAQLMMSRARRAASGPLRQDE